ncbi:hypothetical protein AMTR_s00053p00090160 [Amborella trichopoda]|uniref:Uncharacterized protein n=1 Tax=Amborella trichopoda TaxID=13333 RepID=W1PBG6_AMBTC|nr:hypothetical protein AMTR_s00053p00090160 [Amborella trichopoda]
MVVEAIRQMSATSPSFASAPASTSIPIPSVEGECMKALADAYGEDFSPEVAYKAADIFLQPGRANMFLAMPLEYRRGWIEREFRKT